MLFAALFTDKPGHGAMRAENLEAHIRWVAEHREAVLVAGSLRIEPGAVPEGGLWIVEVTRSRIFSKLLFRWVGSWFE